jgi:pimeloyl-ACP methyl ester carboxylesterase
MEMFRASDGLRLSYVIDDYTDPWRKSEALVMLHAAMAARAGFMRGAAPRTRFSRDPAGIARTWRVGTPGPDQLTFERLTKDVVELLDHLGIDKAHIAGSSAALHCAERGC